MARLTLRIRRASAAGGRAAVDLTAGTQPARGYRGKSMASSRLLVIARAIPLKGEMRVVYPVLAGPAGAVE